MIYDCCVCQKKCRSILKHVLKRDNRKSCRRSVVSLLHATKSYNLCKSALRVLLEILRINKRLQEMKVWWIITTRAVEDLGLHRIPVLTLINNNIIMIIIAVKQSEIDVCDAYIINYSNNSVSLQIRHGWGKNASPSQLHFKDLAVGLTAISIFFYRQ